MMSGFRGLSHSFIKFDPISPDSEITRCKGFLFITSNLLLQIAHDSVVSAEKKRACEQVISSAAPNNQSDQPPPAVLFPIISQISSHQPTESKAPHQIPCFPPISLLQGLGQTAATAWDSNLTS